MPDAHMVTFGSVPSYEGTLKRIEQEARATGYFASVKPYTQNMLPELGAHSEFIARSRRGYGYWIWKPLVLLRRMAEIPEGDLILYADAGCSFYATPAARAAWDMWVQKVQEDPSGRLAFCLTHMEETWTKGGVLERFGVRSGPAAKSVQNLATISLWVNTAANRAFIKEWFDICVENGYVNVSDAPMSVPNASSFRDHRHDQSIYSLMIKRDGAVILEDPGMTGTDQPVKITRIRQVVYRRF
jgi:hypothetical protein